MVLPSVDSAGRFSRAVNNHLRLTKTCTIYWPSVNDLIDDCGGDGWMESFAGCRALMTFITGGYGWTVGVNAVLMTLVF